MPVATNPSPLGKLTILRPFGRVAVFQALDVLGTAALTASWAVAALTTLPLSATCRVASRRWARPVRRAENHPPWEPGRSHRGRHASHAHKGGKSDESRNYIFKFLFQKDHHRGHRVHPGTKFNNLVLFRVKEGISHSQGCSRPFPAVGGIRPDVYVGLTNILTRRTPFRPPLWRRAGRGMQAYKGGSPGKRSRALGPPPTAAARAQGEQEVAGCSHLACQPASPSRRAGWVDLYINDCDDGSYVHTKTRRMALPSCYWGLLAARSFGTVPDTNGTVKGPASR